VAKSRGKGPREYIEGASSRLDRAAFELDIRGFVGQQWASKLDATHVQVLFDISDEYCRQLDAVYSMKRDRLIQDWSHRRKIIATTNAKLAALREVLKKSAENQRWPVTALYAEAVHDRLALLQKKLDHEVAQIKQHQRLSRIMLKALQLKKLRSGYVAELHNYIANVAFPDSPRKEQNALIAARCALPRNTRTKNKRRTCWTGCLWWYSEPHGILIKRFVPMGNSLSFEHTHGRIPICNRCQRQFSREDRSIGKQWLPFGMRLCAADIKAEITKSFCHAAIDRRTVFRLYCSIELEPTKHTEVPQFHSWIVQHVVQTLNEITLTMNQICQRPLRLGNILVVGAPKGIW